jgi:hypothetical protein
MEGLIVDAEKFAIRFNSLFRGAHRKINAEDIREMTKCNLIGRRGYFEQLDLHTVNGILRYEFLRAQRLGKPDNEHPVEAVSMEKQG